MAIRTSSGCAPDLVGFEEANPVGDLAGEPISWVAIIILIPDWTRRHRSQDCDAPQLLRADDGIEAQGLHKEYRDLL